MKHRFLSIVMSLIIIICGFSIKPVDAKVKIKLNKKSVSIVKGKKYKLKVKGTKRKVKWSSKNKKIATVSKKGYVKAKKVGTTYIYAKIGKKKLKCKVKVKNPPFCKIYDEDIDYNSCSFTIKNLSNSDIIIESCGGMNDDIDYGLAWAELDSDTITIKPKKSKRLLYIAYDDVPGSSSDFYNCSYYIQSKASFVISLYNKGKYYIYGYDKKSGGSLFRDYDGDFLENNW